MRKRGGKKPATFDSSVLGANDEEASPTGPDGQSRMVPGSEMFRLDTEQVVLRSLRDVRLSIVAVQRFVK
jgi:hypothetical protein